MKTRSNFRKSLNNIINPKPSPNPCIPILQKSQRTTNKQLKLTKSKTEDVLNVRKKFTASNSKKGSFSKKLGIKNSSCQVKIVDLQYETLGKIHSDKYTLLGDSGMENSTSSKNNSVVVPTKSAHKSNVLKTALNRKINTRISHKTKKDVNKNAKFNDSAFHLNSLDENTSKGSRTSVVLRETSSNPIRKTKIDSAVNVSISESLDKKNKTCKLITASKENVDPEDPYELSNGKNDVEPIKQNVVKRKFFSNQRTESSKKSMLSAYELIRRKIYRQARQPLTTRVIQPKSAAPFPMSNEERLRIASTTIWLPMPPISQSTNAATCFSTPVSGNQDRIMTSKSLVNKHPSTSAFLMSPILPAKPSVGYSVENTEVNFTSTHPLPSVVPSKSDQVLSHHTRPKSSNCSNESSVHSASTRKKSTSHEEDASNYAEWLDEFNAQLQSFEQHNLSIE